MDKKHFSKTLEKNKIYHIDKGYKTGGEVRFICYTNIRTKIFCRVEDPDTGTIWATMANRLYKLEDNG